MLIWPPNFKLHVYMITTRTVTFKLYKDLLCSQHCQQSPELLFALDRVSVYIS